MKKSIGILLILLLVASLVLVITGVFQVFRYSNGLYENEEEKAENQGDENTENDDENGDEKPEDDDVSTDTTPEPEPEPEPEPAPEYGVQTEYTETLETVEGENTPMHMLSLAFDENVTDAIPVKIYFGTLITAETAEGAENSIIRISILDGNASSLLVAEINGKDFYNDKYVCEILPDSSSVKYTRLIDVTLPSALVGAEKGAVTVKLAVSSIDAESGVETLVEISEKNIYYKKTETGYELSHKKETTPVYNYEYLTDISDYIGYIEPTGSLWSDNYLLLVNPWNPIANGEELTYDVVSSQVRLGDIDEYNFYYQPSLMLNATAAKALTAMFNEALATGQFQAKHLQVVSAYRSYGWQESIFNRNVSKTKKYVCNNADCAHEYITKNSYTKCEICKGSVTNVTITLEEAQTQVKTYSCAPGTSEHQTGLTVDLADTTKSSAILEEPFKDTAAGKWLAANCARFGFILRFEKEKEPITGIIYEPWHFRYVGRYHATRITELGLCLEEYIDLLKEEGYFEDADSIHNPANMEIDEETFLIVGEN